MDLYSPIHSLKGVGEKTEKVLNKVGIYRIGDLLEYFPRNYDIFQPPVDLAELRQGHTQAVMQRIRFQPKASRGGRYQIVTYDVVEDGVKFQLIWYNMPYIKNKLYHGAELIFRGPVTFKKGRLLMEQPAIFTREEYSAQLNAMQPIYPLTDGLSNNLLTKLLKQVLESIDLSNEFLPEEIRNRYQLAKYNDAVREIHFPKDMDHMLVARKRLAFDEFFLFSLALKKMKGQKEITKNGFYIEEKPQIKVLIDQLPYSLTDAQLGAWEDIKRDMCGELTMNRLIQGDVGSGKTIIAVLALLNTVLNGYQGSMMVPTEVLAKQHYESLTEQLVSYGVNIQLLVGSMTAKEKRLAYERIENGEADVVIGTHALIQERVNFKNLALVITDEQHRFGVRQREFLSEKGLHPHVMVMSATPIPRTLALILYSDLDISVIDQMPAMRLPIKNCVVDTNYRNTAYKFIEKQVHCGHQAYVICPMVEEGEMEDVENVIEYTEKIRGHLPSDIKVEYLHGKQKPKEKNEIMTRFYLNEIQVLVSTTVIEVGVNVPNSTVMMIENAQRFGLAQLHQLRGRVGRGSAQSYCIFINTSNAKEARDRLDVLVKSNDGFFIANEDLKLRGPGDLFGLRQSGLMEFKIGNIFNDLDILKEAGKCSDQLLEEDPELKKYEFLNQKLQLYMTNTLDSLVL